MELIGYLGTMNSAKSALAIMKYHKYTNDNEITLVFKPRTDKRDGSFITSRAIQERVPAIMISEYDFNSMYQLCKAMRPDHLIVDEVQFLSEHHIDELAEISKTFNVKVECYGLKVDFQSRLFEGSKRLIELADRIIEVENDCSTHGCRQPATKNVRFEDGSPTFQGDVIKMGKEETYQSVCLKCYLEMKGQSIHAANKI